MRPFLTQLNSIIRMPDELVTISEEMYHKLVIPRILGKCNSMLDATPKERYQWWKQILAQKVDCSDVKCCEECSEEKDEIANE